MKYTLTNTNDIGRLVNVFLNGVRQKYCIEADADEGYIIAYQLDERGNIKLNGDEALTERFEGVVTVEDRD